jgi:uncharacterized RDD family membrane protein YckC
VKRAGLPRRLAALAYEALLVTAIVFVLGFAMLPLVSPRAASGSNALSTPTLPARVALFLVIFAALAAYFTWSWTGGRATLAQKTWRLRIVERDGAVISRRTALARYLATWIGPAFAVLAYLVLHPRGLGAHAAWLVALNFLWAAIDRDRQFLHDRIAGTRVVQTGSESLARN